MSAPIVAAEPGTAEQAPVIKLDGLTARTRSGPIFSDVSFAAERGDLVAVVGGAGTGRTSLLLAIAGRFPVNSGVALVAGHHAHTEADRIRHLVAVARANPGIVLDDALRVGELMAERLTLARPAVVPDSLANAFDTLGLNVSKKSQVRELVAVEQLLLAVGLAAASAPRVLVVDDVDAGLTETDTERAWLALRRLADTGITVVGSSLRTTPLADQVVELGGRA